jgi:hypothetical protein
MLLTRGADLRVTLPLVKRASVYAGKVDGPPGQSVVGSTGGCGSIQRRRAQHRRSDTLYEDAMIAATAAVHNLTVVTRNVADFAKFDVRVLNPFKTARP